MRTLNETLLNVKKLCCNYIKVTTGVENVVPSLIITPRYISFTIKVSGLSACTHYEHIFNSPLLYWIKGFVELKCTLNQQTLRVPSSVKKGIIEVSIFVDTREINSDVFWSHFEQYTKIPKQFNGVDYNYVPLSLNYIHPPTYTDIKRRRGK